MQVDRRKFFASVGGAAAVAAMAHEDRAEALEHYMTDQLDRRVGLAETAQASTELQVPRGTGNLFRPTASGFEPMPEKPTLVDFFERRFAPARHVLQSANRAIETGQPERTVFACLLHDVTQNLIKADHGYWGAQLFAPYVDERVSWGIKYHQALRFFPDDSVGYEYPVRREPARDRDRRVHRHHRPAVRAAEGRAGVRQQPHRPHVALAHQSEPAVVAVAGPFFRVGPARGAASCSRRRPASLPGLPACRRNRRRSGHRTRCREGIEESCGHIESGWRRACWRWGF